MMVNIALVLKIKFSLMAIQTLGTALEGRRDITACDIRAYVVDSQVYFAEVS
jgi:hypothetical protein